MPVLLTVSLAVLIGVSMLASRATFADNGDAKAPSKSPATRLEGGKDSNGTAKALPPKSSRAKAWNEMTPEERKAANNLYLNRPKKWEDMTKAERDAASKAWLFSTGDW